MTHCLREPVPDNPITAPLVASLRYRCQCSTNEVLNIQVVMDVNATEEQFVWTMRSLWRDVKFEVEQHLKEAA